MLVFLTFNMYSQTLVPKEINKPTTWTKSGSPYVVDSDGVDINAKLIIEAGTIIKLKYYPIRAYAEIKISGNANDTILFTSFYNDGYNIAIDVYDTNTILNINYCKIENANYFGVYLYKGAKAVIGNSRFTNCNYDQYASGIYMKDSSIDCTIDSCLFDKNNYGVQCSSNNGSDSKILIKNSEFINNYSGATLPGSIVEITGCVFKNNEYGVRYYNYWESYININKCTFSSNKYGIAVGGAYPSFATISCDYFYNSTYYDIIYRDDSYSFSGYENVEINDCYFGTSDSTEIASKIYDNTDDVDLKGMVIVNSPLTDDKIFITTQPLEKTVCPNEGITLLVQSNYKDANYLWFKDSVSLAGNSHYNGVETNTLSINAVNISDDGKYFCHISNNCQFVNSNIAKVTVKQPYDNDTVGIVTVSENGKNVLVAWERTANKGTVKYRVYREGLTNDYGNYIAEKLFSDTSMYVDKTASVDTRAYRYLVTTVDECNNELPKNPAKADKTIHLQQTMVNGELHFNWTEYEGATVKGYYLLAGDSLNKLDTLDRFAADLTSYKISNPGKKKYRIAAIFAGTVNTTILKSDGGPYSQSLSNLAESELLGDSPVDSGVEFAVFPNPSNGTINCVSIINADVESLLSVYDNDGRLVKTKKIGPVKSLDEKIDLPPGVYNVKLKAGNVEKTQQVIVN